MPNPTYGMSGNSYVPARLRAEPNAEPAPLKVAAPSRCDHMTTICPTRDCVESWLWDWDINFRRTAGGRRLYRATYGGDATTAEALA